jgi:5'-3' exonuclease
MEADDVISWLTWKATPNIVISGDQDLLQLVNENTSVYMPIKKKLIDHINFEKEIAV